VNPNILSQKSIPIVQGKNVDVSIQRGSKSLSSMLTFKTNCCNWLSDWLSDWLADWLSDGYSSASGKADNLVSQQDNRLRIVGLLQLKL
jgi:hypothetical protein